MAINVTPAGAAVTVRYEGTIAGWRTSILEAGKSGSPVLLLHGSSLAVDAHLTWFRTIPALSNRYRVITYDQPGFGFSEVPTEKRYPDRLERAEHAAELVEVLGLHDLTAVGHSEGGFIAARLAITHPECISRLVIVASGGTAPRLGDDRDTGWMQAAARAYDYVARSVDVETFVRSEGFLRHTRDAAFEEVLRANFRHAQCSGNLDMFLARQRRSPDYADYTDLQERTVLPFLANLRVPALLIWGERDETVPVARGWALAACMRDAMFEVVPRAGHWVMHEAPEAFNRLLCAWLDG